MIGIKDTTGNIRFSTPVNEGSKRKFLLMKEDYITLRFSVDTPVYFKLGDYVECDLGRFELCDPYKPTFNNSTGGYLYDLRLDAHYWKWKNKTFKFTPEAGGQEASWNLTAPLDAQMGVFLRNLKALGYKYGGKDFEFSIDSTVENKALLMTYNNTSVLDSLFEMAKKWDCECWVTDNVIHLGRCEFGDPVEFELGRNVETMDRSDGQDTYATRIYAFGSTRNIPVNYRPIDESLVVNGVVQKRLMLPAGTPCVDAYPGMGTEEAIEDIVVFEDVYPRMVGTVSNVTTHEYTDRTENGDGTATDKKWNAYRFKDSGITFSKDYVLPGQELRIRFQSGLLNGMEFGVIFNPDQKNPEEQLWEIVRNEDYGRPLPDDALRPRVEHQEGNTTIPSDTYVLSGFDTKLVSDSMIPEAERELMEKAEKYMERSKTDPSTYNCKMMSDRMVDKLGNPILFEIGGRVSLVNAAFFETGKRQSRVIGFEYNLDFPHDSPVYTIGETASYSRIGELEDKLESLTYKGETYVGNGGSGIYLIRSNDSTPATDSNAYSARRSLLEFISKRRDDIAHGTISFERDIILPGADGSIYSDRNANDFNHEEGFRLWADGTAWLKDLRVKNDSMFAGSLSSPLFVSGFPGGTGWMLAPYRRMNAAGVGETRYKLEIDDLDVRGRMRIHEFVVSQLLGENDNRIFAGMMEVDRYDPVTGRLYLDTDGGRLYNPFREDDICVVQQFQGSPTLGNGHDVVKRYEFVVTEVAVGNLSDGEDRLDWIRFKDFIGDLSQIGRRDTVVRVDNLTDPTRKGIVRITTIDEFGAPYLDVAYGMMTDPANATKVRIGNLGGLVTPHFGRLDGYGAYLGNVYAYGKYVLSDTGEDVSTNFKILNGRLSSEMSSVRHEISEKDNYLTNSSFSEDLVGWETDNDVSLLTVRQRFLAVNDGLYSDKERVSGIVEVYSRLALYIKASGIRQLNAALAGRPDSKVTLPGGGGKWPTFHVSMMVRAKTAGTLTVGFPGQGLYGSVGLAVMDGFERRGISGDWDGSGDFIIDYTGEIYIYNVTLTNRPLDDFRVEMSTRLEQTDKEIGLYARKLDGVGKTVTDMGVRLDNTTETLSLYVTKTDEISGKVTDLGIQIDGVERSLTLYAKSEDVSGDKLVSYINLQPESVKISSKNIDLEGKVTFSMFDTDTSDRIDGKADSKSLGAMAYEGAVGEAMLDSTVIAGGYIKASLINVDEIWCTSLAAVRGTIAAFEISGNRLKNTDGSAGLEISRNERNTLYLNRAGDSMISVSIETGTGGLFQSYGSGIALQSAALLGGTSISSSGSCDFTVGMGDRVTFDLGPHSGKYGHVFFRGLMNQQDLSHADGYLGFVTIDGKKVLTIS